MLHNPQWKRETLEDLIAWLETKDPDDTYDFWNCNSCLTIQWQGNFDFSRWPRWVHLMYQGQDAGRIAVGHGAASRTFNRALTRARGIL